MKNLRIATRPSRLALIQASIVAGMLRCVEPHTGITIVEIATTGDRDDRDFLQKAPTVGFFTSGVEAALIDGRADIAVHSLKDLPTASNPSLVIAAIPPREDPCDVIIAPRPISSLADIPQGSRVGTSSLRRQGQLLRIRPDLKILPIRGNVETRIAKMDRGDYDAVVLAAAGLTRLNLADRISLRLPADEFLTAPGQGAMAVQAKADDSDSIAILSRIDHLPTRIAAEAEREILAELHGGCSIPLGVHSKIDGETITLFATLTTPDGKKMVHSFLSGPAEEAITIARYLAGVLLASGGSDIIASLRDFPIL
jgi:hydroxymethylbilane synthase